MILQNNAFCVIRWGTSIKKKNNIEINNFVKVAHHKFISAYTYYKN